MTDILAISNAVAGGPVRGEAEVALSVLRSAHSVAVAATTGLDDLERAIRDHSGTPTIVVLGGDGSLHAVVECLHRMGILGDVRVGLVPLGTGNDFARRAGLSREAGVAARQLLTAEPRAVDLIVDDTGTVVVNAVHLGLGAEAAAAAVPWKKALGPVGYAIGAAISGFTRRGLDLSVVVDGDPIRGGDRVLQVAIGIGTYVGGGAPLLPGASLSNGLLEVAVSYANGPLHRLAYVAHLRRGQHTGRDDVVNLRGSRVEVSGQPFRCSADGEIGAPMRRRSWQIEPGALTMLLPHEEP